MKASVSAKCFKVVHENRLIHSSNLWNRERYREAKGTTVFIRNTTSIYCNTHRGIS